MIISYLSLGSNIGARIHYLTQALRKLNSHQNIIVSKISSIYETKAWGRTNQANFYNIATQIKTNYSPQELLNVCQAIEQQLMRTREIHWGPRTIDIDILLCGNLTIKKENLTIPHPYMLEREFVIAPLYEIAPNLSINKIEISTIIKKFDRNSTCIKLAQKIEL